MCLHFYASHPDSSFHLSLTPSPPISMSSTVQATSSMTTSPTSNMQLITNALLDYTNQTGIDLSENPFAVEIERANSPAAILELLQERERAFKDYREGNRGLISCLSPTVNIIQALSGILGQVRPEYHLGNSFTQPRQVPHLQPAKPLFVAIDVLLSVRSFNTLFKPFPCDI
jgi:hypothetical protein